MIGRGDRSPARRRAVIAEVAAAIAGLAATAALFEAMAVRIVAGNSDGATVLLEGRSIASGHVLLGGWMLSLDSFWTIDALANALAVGIVGVEPQLLRAVPIAIAIGAVAAAVIAATYRLSGSGRAIAVTVVASLLVLPTRPLAFFLLQGPYHVGTALYCLVAFAAFAPKKLDGRWAVGVVLLAAGILGDFQTFTLGVAPVVAVGLLDGHRTRRVVDAAPLVGGGAAAVVLAVVARAIARATGGFRPTKANTLASGHQMIHNLGHLPNEALALLGLTTGPFGPTGVPVVLDVFHIVVVGAIIAAVVAAGWRMLIEVRRRPGASVDPLRRFEDTLCVAVVADLATFVLLPITSSDAYARYLTAGVIFATILAARFLARSSTGAAAVAAVVVAGAVAVVGVVTFAFALGGPKADQPATALARYLSAHHLDHGVGDYWSSSIVTVESNGDVAVRPVIASGGRLVRYDKQSASAWYAGVPFQFYVYDSSLDWNGDDRAVGVATFGRPAQTVAVGTYRILVFTSPQHVSVDGSQGP